jgi:hypothetical protein
MRAQLALSLRL